jgi:hypothetical protein
VRGAALLGLLLAGCAATGAPAVTVREEPAQSGSGDSEALAKKLANPIASLISVPVQLNRDTDIGLADEGERLLLNVQPVIPFSLGDDWNLISRTIDRPSPIRSGAWGRCCCSRPPPRTSSAARSGGSVPPASS